MSASLTQPRAVSIPRSALHTSWYDSGATFAQIERADGSRDERESRQGLDRDELVAERRQVAPDSPPTKVAGTWMTGLAHRCREGTRHSFTCPGG